MNDKKNNFDSDLPNFEDLKNLKIDNEEMQKVMNDLNLITNLFMKKFKSTNSLFNNLEDYTKTIYQLSILIGYYAKENDISFVAIVNLVQVLGNMASDRFMGFLSAIHEGMNY